MGRRTEPAEITTTAVPGDGILRRYLAARKRTFATLVADLRTMRKNGPLRAAPEKGVRRAALLLGWLAIHIFALVSFWAYGALAHNPAHGTWWVLLTALAGFLYVELMYSDPGFIRGPELQALCDRQGLDLLVGGTDVSRGLLADVEIALPSMHELLPVAEHAAEAEAAAAVAAAAPVAAVPAAEADTGAGIAPAAEAAAPHGGGDGHSHGHADAHAHAHGDDGECCAHGHGDGDGDGGDGADAHEHGHGGEAAKAGGDGDENGHEHGHSSAAAAEDDAAAEAEPTEAEAARQREKEKLELYFVGWADAVELHVPIRGKYCKKHGRIVGAGRDYFRRNSRGAIRGARSPTASLPPQASLTTTATRWATRWASSTTAPSGASSSCRPRRSGRASSCSTTRTSRSAGASCGRRSTRRSSPSTS